MFLNHRAPVRQSCLPSYKQAMNHTPLPTHSPPCLSLGVFCRFLNYFSDYYFIKGIEAHCLMRFQGSGKSTEMACLMPQRFLTQFSQPRQLNMKSRRLMPTREWDLCVAGVGGAHPTLGLRVCVCVCVCCTENCSESKRRTASIEMPSEDFLETGEDGLPH